MQTFYFEVLLKPDYDRLPTKSPSQDFTHPASIRLEDEVHAKLAESVCISRLPKQILLQESTCAHIPKSPKRRAWARRDVLPSQARAHSNIRICSLLKLFRQDSDGRKPKALWPRGKKDLSGIDGIRDPTPSLAGSCSSEAA